MLGDSVEVWTEKSILYWFVEGRNSYRHAKISKIALAPQKTKIGYSSFKFKHYLQACTTSDKNVETLHARQPVENYRAPTPTVLKGSFNTARAFFIFTLSDAKGADNFLWDLVWEFSGITAPGMEPLYVPLVPSFPLEKIETVTCWEWSGPALSEGADADEWFSKYVGKPTRLVRFDTGMEWLVFFVYFCNGFVDPFLLLR